MTRVVHLHIGAPKTGATYLRDRLALNAESLARHGVEVPTRGRVPADVFHFRAALDLLDQDWGGEPGHAVGGWDAMLKQVAGGADRVVISHEILAAAPPEKITRALNDLSEHEIHIVYTARDLGRVLPAAWQEAVRQGRPWSFGRFLQVIERGESWFSVALDLPTSLNRWSARLPPERVHVVTVPHERGIDVLWDRFATACGFDPAWAPKDSERVNRSLGADETQVLRQLNKRLGPDLRTHETFDVLVQAMTHGSRAEQRRRVPVTLPAEAHDAVEEHVQRWIDWIEGSGVQVVGDVEDLRPRPRDPDAEWVDPDALRPQLQLEAASDALAALAREHAQGAERSKVAQAVRRRTRKWGWR